MKKLAIAGIAVGSLLTLAPLWGFLGTLFGMIYSFQEVEAAQTTPDPSALADNISLSFNSLAVGILLCPVGVVLLFASIAAFVKLSGPAKQQDSGRMIT